jgi:fructose-bisphosphate aldolase class II
MALVPLRLLLDHAAENGYGIPAFNKLAILTFLMN